MTLTVVPPEPFPVLRKNPEIRAAILALEKLILAGSELLDTADITTRHMYAEGVYLREMSAVAGTLITGMVQYAVNANIISKGKVLVATEAGTITYTAPCTFISPLGDKRVIWVMEDTIWTSIHSNPNNSQDYEAWELLHKHSDYTNLLTGE
jgi:hypothetical protein